MSQSVTHYRGKCVNTWLHQLELNMQKPLDLWMTQCQLFVLYILPSIGTAVFLG